VIKFYIRTNDTLTGGIRAFRDRLQAKIPDAVEESCERVLQKAQQLVPYDMGTLHDSGRIEKSEKGYAQRVVFGGAGIPYAVAIHEHLSASSPRSWKIAEASGNPVRFKKAGTGPKYLERPLLEEASLLAGTWAQTLNWERI